MQKNQLMNVSCEIKQKSASVYDYDRGCGVDISFSSQNTYSLFDYGASNFVDLQINGAKFSE